MPINYSKHSKPYRRTSRAIKSGKPVERTTNRAETEKADHRDIVVKPYNRMDDVDSNKEKLKDIQAGMKPIRSSQRTDLNGG